MCACVGVGVCVLWVQTPILVHVKNAIGIEQNHDEIIYIMEILSKRKIEKKNETNG